jgi:haloacid dehalogenase superfamily, subfamily IA, variant 1 with third motif having Dx(3-4)D or Dx(3-4)E
MRDSGHQLFGDAHEEGIRVFYDIVKKRHVENLVAHEGAEALLHHVKGRGIYVGIVSNKEGDLLRKEVAHLGWTEHFHQIVGSRDTEADKPSHIPVLRALKPSTIRPGKEVWFVGDSITDVQCARATGCTPFVVGEGDAATEKDVIHIQDCINLAQFIESL